MSFTTIDAVAAHFPGFQRGVPGQNPSDAQIQAWIDSQAARISALALSRGYTLDNLATTNPTANAMLALINELGAAADLGDALFSLLGPEAAAQGWAQPATLRRSFENTLGELERGAYDKLFIPAARTGDVFPAFGGVAGQETDRNDPETDLNVSFKKDDVF
ncbi:MAG TPA: hypothetical protein VFD30_23020 [Terriglobia bacterium]|jgi:hypothetical protein|nr:hypothetical protein [Terriglobia bacterium]